MRSKREADKYLQQYPKLRRWINQCRGCQREGYKPILPRPTRSLDFSHAYKLLRELFQPLELDNSNLCKQCRGRSE